MLFHAGAQHGFDRRSSVGDRQARSKQNEAQQVYPGNGGAVMIRKLASGEYRLFSKKKDPRTGKRKNLGTFSSRAAAEKHERAVQYFKRAG